MLNEQYIHTFKYKYNPLFPIEEEELRKFVEEILPFMEETIMKKLRTYNVYSMKEYEDIRKAVRYSIRFCKKHKIVRYEG